MNGNTWLMLVGTAAGASALLLAPAGGKALRATVQAKSYLDLQRLHAEWRARMAEHPRSVQPDKGNG